MTKVTVDIEQLRGAASSLSSSATTIEEKYNTLVNSANAVYVPTESLASVPGYVEDLRDKSKTLDAKVDLAILINSGDTGNVPQSGTLSYEVDGADPTDLVGMEYAIGRAMADMGQEMAPHLEHILETYLPAAATAYRQDHSKKDPFTTLTEMVSSTCSTPLHLLQGMRFRDLPGSAVRISMLH